MKQKILDLIIAAKRTDSETGSFAEWLAEYLVEHGVTVQEWIPVEERLPDKPGRYLVMLRESLWRLHDEYVSDFDGKRFFGEGACFGEVTHWMPLPEIPGKDGA